MLTSGVTGHDLGDLHRPHPVRRAISHAFYQPDFCMVSASAKLLGGGIVHVALSYSPTGPVIGYAAKCADDAGNSSALRTKIQLWSCLGNASQQWTYSGGELKHGTMCMNDKGGGGSGTPVVLWDCTGAGNEIWSHTSGGEYVLKSNGLCLDDPAYSTRNGTQLIVYRCNGDANQRWSLP